MARDLRGGRRAAARERPPVFVCAPRGPYCVRTSMAESSQQQKDAAAALRRARARVDGERAEAASARARQGRGRAPRATRTTRGGKLAEVRSTRVVADVVASLAREAPKGTRDRFVSVRAGRQRDRQRHGDHSLLFTVLAGVDRVARSAGGAGRRGARRGLTAGGGRVRG
mmetsp:Transcript_17587/g.61864  ORF Transcript_17587/g.61864 Transcript_17587/m.61864 type:complete len:170 (-) Transcript_17587:205-714(-)